MGVKEIKEIMSSPEAALHFGQVVEKNREAKIDFCYFVARLLDEEIECPFEDMLPENLQKVYEYCVEKEYKLRNE
ncbi:hypothetical protein MG295_00219 [Bacillus phage vB_BcgM]|nr:hypothetical protein MG295_00219 [Bacillus phage vB_BcgM]